VSKAETIRASSQDSARKINRVVATTGIVGVNRLVWIDPASPETRSLNVNVPNNVAIGGGSVWVTTAGGAPNTVVRITPSP
jgi:hypothetical protein